MARHLAQLIEEQVRQRPAATLLVSDRGHDVLSYDAAWVWAAAAAEALSKAGAVPGRPVLVRAPKSVELLVAYLGALRLGAVWTPLAPDATAGEFARAISDAVPTLVVDGAQAVADVVTPRPAPGAGPRGDDSWHTPTPAPDAIAAMLYTSGTTGSPKGVPLSGSALAANARALCQAWQFTEDDVVVHALPTHHAHGLFVALGCALVSGASLRWLEHFDAGAVLAALPESTVFMGVPTHYARLLDRAEFTRAACANVRLATSGSAPLSASSHRIIAARTGLEVVERYGTTETLMITSNPIDGSPRPGSVGTPLPGVEVRLGRVDVAEDEVAPTSAVGPASAVGMVEVRGPSVFGGYWGHRRSEHDWCDDGWFRTGDLGHLDDDGYLHLVGRAKDLVISGGLNVYPAEVEAVLNAHDGVAEAAVIGTPDLEWGERVTAVVAPTDRAILDDPTAVDALALALTEFCREELSAYKVPRQWHVVAELPRNTMGKVTKNALRSAYSPAATLAARHPPDPT